MSKEVILGIDTSNYTTSLAILSPEGEVIANLKRPLPVKPGERGLRQSDAVFAHTVNIPRLLDEAKKYIDDAKILCVGVSEKPRNAEGSYMPCFLSGLACAAGICMGRSAPLYKFSHQCGHIMAAVYSSGRWDLLDGDFAAFHVSGGTTELVKVTPCDNGFSTEIIGGTADLNAGQLIDRIGVYAGLKFPAGPAMEAEALKNDKKIPRKKISAKDFKVNLSGLENMAVKLYDETSDLPLAAAFTLDCVGRAILSLMDAYEEQYGKTSFVCAGGVMCNSIIKKMLSENHSVAFADPALSADNAVGVAVLALRKYKTENNI